MAIVVIVLLCGRSGAIQLAGNWVGHVGQLLLLLLEVLSGGRGTVLVEPVMNFLDSIQNGLLVILIDLATEAFFVADLVLKAEGIVLKAIPGLDLSLDGTVLLGKLLCFGDHALNILWGQAALVILDCDTLRLSSALVTGTDLQNTVGIQVKGDLNLRDTTWGGGDISKLKLAKNIVVLGERTLSFDCRILVCLNT